MIVLSEVLRYLNVLLQDVQWNFLHVLLKDLWHLLGMQQYHFFSNQ